MKHSFERLKVFSVQIITYTLVVIHILLMEYCSFNYQNFYISFLLIITPTIIATIKFNLKYIHLFFGTIIIFFCVLIFSPEGFYFLICKGPWFLTPAEPDWIYGILIAIEFFIIESIGFAIGYVFNGNQKFYDFENKMKNEFNYIHDITFSNTDLNCTINIFLHNDNFNYDKVESVLIKTIIYLANSTNYLLFEKKHGGKIEIFHICFKKKNDNQNLYKFTSQNITLWRLNSIELKEYNVCDYIKNNV